MENSFFKWVWQAIIFTIFSICVFFTLNWFQINIGTATLWVSGVLSYWVLSGLVILPWNVYFAADDALNEIAQTEEKGGKPSEQDKEYAKIVKKRAGKIAIISHIITSLIFLFLAIFTTIGIIAYIGAFAAILLTGLRPAIRTMEHVRYRLRSIQDKAKFPRNDVYELQKRVLQLEEYDQIAKDLKEVFIKKTQELQKDFSEKIEAVHEIAESQNSKIRDIEKMLIHQQNVIVQKIDSFEDAVAFKTAWDRVAPELAKIFRPSEKH